MLISGITGIDLTGLPINNSGNTEVEGNLNLSGVGARITGDFSNSTLANRVAFQTSTLNGATSPFFIPNGTGTKGQVVAGASSDSSNSSYISIMADSSTGLTSLNSGASGTGSFLPMIFTTNGSERVRIDTAGNVGIGATPSAWHTSFKAFEIMNGCALWTANGTPNMYLTSNALYDGTYKYIKSGNLAAKYEQSGNHTWSIAPSGTAGNQITWTNAMVLDTSGKLLLQSGTGGLGYGTGAGGTVTQLTSKASTVTLNKPSGRITMNNAALAAGASVSFSLLNSLITTNDVVYLAVAGGISVTASYQVWSNNGANGVIDVNVKNIHSASLAEALVIDFKVIKGATA